VTLAGKQESSTSGEKITGKVGQKITAIVNGKQMVFPNNAHHSLHQMLRDNALLTGVKEGCGEGECGACKSILMELL